METDIQTVDDFFLVQIGQLFDNGASLARLIEDCLSHEGDDDTLDRTSLGSGAVAKPNEPNESEEKTQQKETETEPETHTETTDTKLDNPTISTKATPSETTPSNIIVDIESSNTTNATTTTEANTTEEPNTNTDTTNTIASLPLPLPTTKRSKSSMARNAIEQLVAFRRQIESIIKYAAVNKEAVRKIIKKHDKQTAQSDAPRLEFIMQEHVNTKTSFATARTTIQIVRSLELVSQLRTKIILKSTQFSNYYERLQNSSELLWNRQNNTTDATNKMNQDTTPLLLRRSTQAILNNGESDIHHHHHQDGSSSDPCIVPLCCGLECVCSIGKINNYIENERILNKKHQNDCCGKYCLKCIPSYRHRKWVIWLIGLFLCLFSLLLMVYAIQPAKTETLIILGVIGAVILAFANGANDIANSMGTSVRSLK